MFVINKLLFLDYLISAYILEWLFLLIPTVDLNVLPNQPLVATFEGTTPSTANWLCASLPIAKYQGRWLHNGSYDTRQSATQFSTLSWSSALLNDSGTYECQTIPNSANRSDLSVQPVQACTITHIIIRE